MMAGLELLIGGLANVRVRANSQAGAAGCARLRDRLRVRPLFYHVTAATCCAVRGFMAPWIPVSFLGIELALASKPWRRRLLPIFLAGFGMSQFYASFLGQGALDAMLLLAAYVAYRAFLNPPERGRGARERILTGIGVGAARFCSAGFWAQPAYFPALVYIEKPSWARVTAGSPTSSAGT